ncbi:hypothetical protein WT27_18975 [Burkholderia territorii]|uniref:Uncharacterized protein n=1 Tax=Burkholderia territorii TaxID=1503055 RepID=A0A119DKT5_9BURK|nr:hypothetical protein WT27_18975 [Burkholderia territorii]KVX34942.1 hypothetical protein WT31_07130 [Burkholderia territorii]
MRASHAGATGGSLHHRRLREVVQARERRDAVQRSDSTEIVRIAPYRIGARMNSASCAGCAARRRWLSRIVARPRIRWTSDAKRV